MRRLVILSWNFGSAYRDLGWVRVDHRWDGGEISRQRKLVVKRGLRDDDETEKDDKGVDVQEPQPLQEREVRQDCTAEGAWGWKRIDVELAQLR